ncbi:MULTISPECIES: DNA-3-methyladenine glycosylase I [Alteromonadaceae]|jgi:3-methyladenine DNA glycosylase Tag|uniref:DNA-3-methyladenine glycosylase I n=1 Tax=Brumicola blandensis TaxID=3075611 RepID=A0AAW8QZY2_9ALTE|nr:MULTISPECIES: DNA-3-methyladenine glycosylase I [unclassified Alteromonas]MDT0582512.1 DNA-3-methyladenine glycosylase I [Alteromonas sp. W409]MDT0628733.1 DNA-3-methyladenine glycosylase I [Alteromonas sp. W364]
MSKAKHSDISVSAEAFASLYDRVCKRKVSEAMVQELISKPASDKEILSISDDRFLAEFTKKVFQSGFVWRVVRQKWPDFEEVFFGFDIDKILLMPDEMLEQKASNPAIIRNFNKVKTIRENALMIDDVRRQHGSFAKFVASWPKDDVVGLWEFLKKNGARLGGNTGPYALRMLGIDTFLLSRDVEAYFVEHGLITGSVRSKRSLKTIQDTFLTWQQESGLSFQELSQIVSYSCGDNYVGMAN